MGHLVGWALRDLIVHVWVMLEVEHAGYVLAGCAITVGSVLVFLFLTQTLPVAKQPFREAITDVELDALAFPLGWVFCRTLEQLLHQGKSNEGHKDLTEVEPSKLWGMLLVALGLIFVAGFGTARCDFCLRRVMGPKSHYAASFSKLWMLSWANLIGFYFFVFLYNVVRAMDRSLSHIAQSVVLAIFATVVLLVLMVLASVALHNRSSVPKETSTDEKNVPFVIKIWQRRQSREKRMVLAIHASGVGIGWAWEAMYEAVIHEATHSLSETVSLVVTTIAAVMVCILVYFLLTRFKLVDLHAHGQEQALFFEDLIRQHEETLARNSSPSERETEEFRRPSPQLLSNYL
eukprot:c5316_g1_i1.p1 GENE.c5316_g1_i1~~c5316_g1_i1.p1  ORF type:complete len:347 (+),score=52.38 c5316_g1_i1:273-1313(+)